MSIRIVAKIVHPFVATMNFLTPFGDLIVRIWVASIFFKSGLLKIQSWETTVNLFTYVYQVPILPPDVAAVLGTGAEIILPILLVLGLGGRFCILIFFFYNIIAVISYPFLWTAGGSMGLQQHINWGLLLMMLMLHGPGKLSLDYWISNRLHPHCLSKKSVKSLFIKEGV